MVEQATSEFITIPEGVDTVFDKIERDEMENFNLPLTSKKQLNHDSWLLEYSFGDAGKDWVLGLKIGGHLIFESHINGKMVMRKYTPVSTINTKGKVDFLIKAYPPTP